MAPPAASHHVITDDEGAPLLVKRATGDEGRERLRREAGWLRQLDLGGVARVVDLVEGDGATDLHLAWIGPHSLATITAVPSADAGRLVAQLADVVAAVHARGVVHRRLVPDHVLLGDDGAPVLTGFADAIGDGRAETGEDVVALGALLTTLVAPVDEGLVVPERRRRWAARDPGLRGALLTLADLVATVDAPDRPTAAELAGRLREVVGSPEAPSGPRPRRRARPTGLRTSGAPGPPTPPSALPLAPAESTGPTLPRIGYGPRVTPSPARARPAPSPAAAPLAAASAPPRPRSPRRLVPRPATGDRTGPNRNRMQRPRLWPRSRADRRGDRRGDPRAQTHTSAKRRGNLGRDPVPSAQIPSLGQRPRRHWVALAGVVLAVVATLGAAIMVASQTDTEVASPNAALATDGPGTTASGTPEPNRSPSRPAAGADDESVPAPPPAATAPAPPPLTPVPEPSEEAPEACPAVPASPAADVDGDGCPDVLRIDQERVTSGGTTWVVGRPGDIVAVGDWDCDGQATVASLRPSTGEVFMFARWVSAGSELTVAAVTVVTGAQTLRAVDDDGDGCARLTARRADGASVDVPVGGAR